MPLVSPLARVSPLTRTSTRKRLGIAEFVGRDDPGSQHVAAVETLALGGAEPALHFHPLPVARGKIVEDRIAEDMRGGLAGGNVRAGSSRHDSDLQFVVHHFAVTRPEHRRAGSDHREAIGDVIDRKLSVDRRHLAERRLQRGAERRLAALGARLQGQHAAWRLADVPFERHRIAHLARLGQRREQFDVGEVQPEIRLAAALGEQRAREIEALVVGVDQRQHRGEGRVRGPLPARRGGNVEHPRRLRVHDSDRVRPRRAISCELHRIPPLPFAEIYTILFFVDNQVRI